MSMLSGRDDVERREAGKVRGRDGRSHLRIQRIQKLQPVRQSGCLVQDAAPAPSRQRRRRTVQRIIAHQHDANRT